MRLTTALRPVVLILLLVLLAGCGGDEGPPQDVRGEPKGDKCKAVSGKLLRTIRSGAADGVSFRLRKGATYRTPDARKMYFVAARLQGLPGGDKVAVWAMKSLRGRGGSGIMAVNGAAQRYTLWPDADETKAQISGRDPAVGRARGCLI